MKETDVFNAYVRMEGKFKSGLKDGLKFKQNFNKEVGSSKKINRIDKFLARIIKRKKCKKKTN